MAWLLADRRELTATLVLYGPPRAGKSTVLQCIHDRVAPERRLNADNGQSVALLDWLAIDVGNVGGWRTRVHLYAVPGHERADATRRVLLGDADGILFVADAQAGRLADNVAARDALATELAGDDLSPPIVFMHAKRDLPGELLIDPAALDEALHAAGAPSFGCDALRGVGVLDALHEAIVLAMRNLAPLRMAS